MCELNAENERGRTFLFLDQVVAQVTYTPIVAGGNNANVLHYIENNSP